MKTILCVMIFGLSTIASAESVQKWVDGAGKTHYGNKADASINEKAETLMIQDTFDQKEYNAGRARHSQNERIGKQYDNERAAEKKKVRKAAKEKGTKSTSSGGATNPKLVGNTAHGHPFKPGHPSSPGHPVQ